MQKKKSGKDRMLIQGQTKAGFFLAREMVPENHHLFLLVFLGKPFPAYHK